MIERYRNWYEHERHCNDRMLTMIELVPEQRRGEAAFGRAVDLAAHLAACRENFAERLLGTGVDDVDWWPTAGSAESPRLRFARVELRWSEYLGAR